MKSDMFKLVPMLPVAVIDSNHDHTNARRDDKYDNGVRTLKFSMLIAREK